MHDAAEVRTDFHFIAGSRSSLDVEIRREWGAFHAAANTSFFKGFATGGGSERGVVVHAAFREGPLAGVGADEQELDFAIRDAITDSSHMGAGRSCESPCRVRFRM